MCIAAGSCTLVALALQTAGATFKFTENHIWKMSSNILVNSEGKPYSDLQKPSCQPHASLRKTQYSTVREVSNLRLWRSSDWQDAAEPVPAAAGGHSQALVAAYIYSMRMSIARHSAFKGNFPFPN